jgi:hypothetical protein
MRVNKYAMPIVLIVAMFAVTLVAQATGAWQVTGSTTVVPTTTSGRPDPEAIKGKMTLDEIITTYGVPKDDLYAGAKLPADFPTSKQAKEIESVISGFELDTLRQAVKDYYAAHP